MCEAAKIAALLEIEHTQPMSVAVGDVTVTSRHH